jgi:peptide/nickel transport system permease protein
MTAVAMQPAPSPLAGLRSAADYLGAIVRHLADNPSSLFGLVVISVLVVLAVFAPLIATQGPNLQNLQAVLQPPSWAHFFGTDEVGRDVFSRIVYGSGSR